MITEITVCSKYMASLIQADRIISILDPDQKAEFYIDENFILRVNFDDVDTDDPYCRPINQDDAKQIVEFFTNIKNEDKEYHVMIHCYAGISRSLSTAMALCDRFEIDKTTISWLKQGVYGNSKLFIDGYPLVRDSEEQEVPLPQYPPNQLVYNLVKDTAI